MYLKSGYRPDQTIKVKVSGALWCFVFAPIVPLIQMVAANNHEAHVTNGAFLSQLLSTRITAHNHVLNLLSSPPKQPIPSGLFAFYVQVAINTLSCLGEYQSGAVLA